MNKRRIISVIIGLIFLSGVIGVSLFLGDKYALDKLAIKHATPDQLAKAMKEDHFFSDNREKTLIVSGTVASVTTNKTDLVIGLKTSQPYKVLCNLGHSSSNVRVGDTVTIVAEGENATRQSSAVLLTHCSIP